MTNQKGDMTLFCISILMVFMGLLLLCAMELQRSFSNLEKRTGLFLCVKETKEELNQYLIFMGRTNWAIKNIKKAGLLTLAIPGLQGLSLQAEKAKKILKGLQKARLVSYLKTLHHLHRKSCPMDPQMIKTSFYGRDVYERAKLRSDKWTYYFFQKPYLLSLEVDVKDLNSTKPVIRYRAQEKGAMSSSLSSSLL